MNTTHSFKIFNSVSELPCNWNDLAATNIFLSTQYLSILETSAPKNMLCHFIGLYQNEMLVGVALSQFINMSDVESFGERDSCFKTKIRHFFFKRFSSNVLIIGNNMLTGQNAFLFDSALPISKGLLILKECVAELKKQLARKGFAVHLTIFKDFDVRESSKIDSTHFSGYFKFTTQPNMVFEIPDKWNIFDDYYLKLNKKYRDQFKRSRKKSDGLIKRQLQLDEIIKYHPKIYDLYYTVAKNAPFNTFYLPADHFIIFKEKLKDNFLFYGYFNDEELIGFNTLIINGCDIDTYFLGYDETCQREKMLYLNMLYDMIGYSINKGYKKLIFARTALEIKSSVGARPMPMFGFIEHSNKLLNYFMPRLFKYFEPELKWQQRHPFKD